MKMDKIPTMANTQQYHRLGITSVGFIGTPLLVDKVAADSSCAP